MFALSLPVSLFNNEYSPVLYDRRGTLLGAMVSPDGQWRFRSSTASPLNEKFIRALIETEDRRFYEHRGVDWRALVRALYQDIKSGSVVSGASTISMQTVRLMRRDMKVKRSVVEKALEMLLALRLELSFSKDQILELYAANAPFGANVVGLEAASWRWFGRASEDLSWGEAATLAVLPNNPGLIHPGRNRETLRAKRNNLIEKLRLRGFIDSETARLAAAEEIPAEVLPLPRAAPHYLALSFLRGGNRVQRSSIDYALQERANSILKQWTARFSERGIHNGACVILDTKSGETLCYAGNVENAEAYHVDTASSPRSSGSILKPFLFAAMLDSGDILPRSLVSDIPTRVGSYSPENNSRNYLGAVSAGEALARSLNVPAVRMLRLYGVEPFGRLLRSLGLTTLFRNNADYGLPLILGGAEVRLDEIVSAYAALGRAALGQNNDFPVSQGAAWLTLEALTFVARPGEEAQWQEFADSRRIAWKTGTSFGNRDAWAVGVTPDWTVGVWIGNASGEGRSGLVSASTSAPVLFELFSALDSMNVNGGRYGSWFPQPASALVPAETCARSGFPAGPDCAETSEVLIPAASPKHSACPYCRRIVLNSAGTARVNTASYDGPVTSVPWFSLPPAEEWYYRRWNLDYKPLPPAENSASLSTAPWRIIALFNPEEGASIFVPREIDGAEGRIVFQAAHIDQSERIFWHLDDIYLGETTHYHEMAAYPAPGRHTLTLVDSAGNTIKRHFEVLNNSEK